MLREFLDYIIIRNSGYFDPAYYLLKYPDCRRADVDPLWHYVTHGWKEGRNPSEYFDTVYYLNSNPDVAASGMNPLVHYLRHGQREGRLPTPRVSVSVAHRRQLTSSPVTFLQKLMYNLGLKIYQKIPHKYRYFVIHWIYTHFGFFLRGTPDYEAWRNHRSTPLLARYFDLIDLRTIHAANEIDGSIGIHVHVFYSDLAEEISKYLRNMPFPYDLYVSVPDTKTEEICRQWFSILPLCRKLVIQKVPNRGRDIAPFICVFGKELSRYNYVAHLHTKKSLYNRGATEGWREYLYRSLLGDPVRIRKIFSLMRGSSPCGIVYPQNYFLLPYWANTWLANEKLAQVWASRLGITEIPKGYFDYPAGSMFWARAEAILPLFQAGITLDDFPEEEGQTDGTLAHTIERFFVLCSLQQGLRPGILKDEEHPSWSSWRFDQYLSRPYAKLLDALSSSKIRLIGFDLFDTLLCRPLLDPETVKKIVARRVGGDIGSLYLQYRSLAELRARQVRGRDVDLAEIMAQLGKETGLSGAVLADLQHLEEKIEEALIEPRQEAIYLYREAVLTGKKVIIITDMFLSRDKIKEFLNLNGITGWHDIFVSSDVGIRKDNGELYHYILEKYEVRPDEFLMIGDNERSDIQTPTDMGASTIHLLRPVELARGLPRFAPIVSAHERRSDIDAELTIGLVIRKNFSPISFPSFDPESLVQVTPYNIGYSLVGPLLVSFADWLIRQARQDGIQRLYFLAREGKLMREIYDYWSEGLVQAPRSDYLIISRRAAGVACINGFEDILDIAKMVYFPNSIENFLYFRYGLSFDDRRWEEIEAATGWSRSAQVSISKDGEIDHLIPLLRFLEKDILQNARNERPALLLYLAQKGMTKDDYQAVVDVGYAGSIQSYLNRLLPTKVHGYYLMTDSRAHSVVQHLDVIVRGCLYENVTRTPHAPAMYRYSFELEKLLSSNDPQVKFYSIDETGNLVAHYHPMQPEELAAFSIREEIRRGALDYAKDARRIREAVLPDFRPSCWTAKVLWEGFLEQRSVKENDLLSNIVLDDHYCGRGLVH